MNLTHFSHVFNRVHVPVIIIAFGIMLVMRRCMMPARRYSGLAPSSRCFSGLERISWLFQAYRIYA